MSITRVDLQHEQSAHAATRQRLVEVEAKLRAAISKAEAKAKVHEASLAEVQAELSKALAEAKGQAATVDKLTAKLEKAKAKAKAAQAVEAPAPQIIRARTLEAEAEIAELRAENSILKRELAEARK